MRVLLFGSTGMVGQGILRECLLDSDIAQVVSVVRAPSNRRDPKLREIVHSDLFDLGPVAGELTDFDAAFWSIGVTSVGMSESEYTRLTYDMTLSVAQFLAPRNPRMTFVYISGQGADSTEHGRSMWARVRGKTENALLRLPFKAVYVLRPGFIQPLHGITSRTRLYRVLYPVFLPLLPIFKSLAPKYFTTTEQLGRLVVSLAKRGDSKHLLEMPDITAFRG